jgi:cyanophycinase
VRRRPIVAWALEDPDRWVRALRLAVAGEVRCGTEPPPAADLASAAGVFVAGGWTPGYRVVPHDGGVAVSVRP